MQRRCPSTGKVQHNSKVAACIAVKRQKNCLLNVYPCSKCKGWHVGNSRDPYRQQKRIDQILSRYLAPADA